MINTSGELPIIYAISDALGETAEFVARAAASQFDSGRIEVRKVPYVTDKDYLREIVEEAKEVNGIIAYTLVLQDLKDYLEEKIKEHQVTAVDILGPMLTAISQSTKLKPKMEPGLLRKLDEDYFRKIEAVEFAVKYDDGKNSRGLLSADVVLIGVSRTSKTPVSMYLAHKRIKTANVPLVPEVSPPEEIFKLRRWKIVGLKILPDALFEIRSERLKALGLAPNADYANKERITKELKYAEEIMERLGCPVVDVTNRAVEETASQVLEYYYKGLRNEEMNS